MCGRFKNLKDIEVLAKLYNALPTTDSKFTGSYNIAPTEIVQIIHDKPLEDTLLGTSEDALGTENAFATRWKHEIFGQYADNLMAGELSFSVDPKTGKLKVG